MKKIFQNIATKPVVNIIFLQMQMMLPDRLLLLVDQMEKNKSEDQA